MSWQGNTFYPTVDSILEEMYGIDNNEDGIRFFECEREYYEYWLHSYYHKGVFNLYDLVSHIDDEYDTMFAEESMEFVEQEVMKRLGLSYLHACYWLYSIDFSEEKPSEHMDFINFVSGFANVSVEEVERDYEQYAKECGRFIVNNTGLYTPASHWEFVDHNSKYAERKIWDYVKDEFAAKAA